MNAAVWILVAIGTVLGLTFSTLVWVDVWLKKNNKPTISSRIHDALGAIGMWPLLMLTFILGSVWGALLWHFVTLESI